MNYQYKKIINYYKILKINIYNWIKTNVCFNGPIFDSHPVYQHIKSLFLDFFRGEETDLQDVAGLQYVIALSAGEVEDLNNDKVLPLVHFRVYKLKSYKSGQNYQELNWMKLVLVLILKLVEELLLLQMLKKATKTKTIGS